MTNPPTEWLHADQIELDIRSPNKRAVIQALADHLNAGSSGGPRAVFDALWEREMLGSTGLGHGVALPHARLATLERPIAAFVRLQRAIPFDAPDDKPVALVLGLLLPRQEPQRQLELLAHIAGMLSDARFRDALSRADSAATVARLFTGGVAT